MSLPHAGRSLPLLVSLVCLTAVRTGAAQSPAAPAKTPATRKADTGKAAREKPAPAEGTRADDKKPDEAAAEEPGDELPLGFIPARVKVSAPEFVHEFFAASDRARLAGLRAHHVRMTAIKKKLQATAKKALTPEELDDAADVAMTDAAAHRAAVAGLLREVGYVPGFETPAHSGESKVLKEQVILKFGRPVRVERVLDEERMLVVVEEQIPGPERKNKAGQLIQPIENRRTTALVKTRTAGMKAGARSQIPGLLLVTGTETLDGKSYFVLEPFVAADYLEQEPPATAELDESK